jgi:hypothetical protein
MKVKFGTGIAFWVSAFKIIGNLDLNGGDEMQKNSLFVSDMPGYPCRPVSLRSCVFHTVDVSL